MLSVGNRDGGREDHQQPTVTMAPWSHHPATASEDSKGLGDLLSTDEVEQLTLLIATVLQVIRRSIEDGFDITVKKSHTSKSILSLESLKPQESVSAASAASADSASPGPSSQKEPIEKDAAPPAVVNQEEQKPTEVQDAVPDTKLKELRTAALGYFFKWQESVMVRVGEAIHSPAGKKEDEVQHPTEKLKDQDPTTHHGQVTADTTTIRPDATTETKPDVALQTHFPPIKTPLSTLPEEKRLLIIHAILLLLLSLEYYPSHSRLLLLYLTSSLKLPLGGLVEQETQTAQLLIEGAKRMSGDAEKEKRSEENRTSRKWKIGLAGVAGAAVIGITGGLAAPLVAAGIGTVLGGIGLGATAAAGLLGTLAESSLVVGALFGAYGASMTSKMMDQYAREVEDFGFLPLRAKAKTSTDPKATEAGDRRLRITIGISGWLAAKEDVVNPWRVIGHNTEPYALRFELKSLMKLGTSLESTVKSMMWSMAKTQVIKRTIFAALLDVLGPLAILKISKIVDNPFSVAKARADKAGLVLADALINKVQGERPVTLIGYSLGARVIYSCLSSLAERHAFGLVESAIFLGSPIPSDSATWRMLKSVVTGRMVNVFSENDFILGFLYRTSSIQYGVAGLQAIDVKGVQNVDASSIISGHLRWPVLVGRSLKTVGWDDLDLEEVAKEEGILELMDEEEQKRERKEEVDADEKEKEDKEAKTEAVGGHKGADAEKKEGGLGQSMGKLHLG